MKSELWKTHLKSYLSKHPNLTEKQKEAIQNTITFLTPQLFNVPPGTPDFQTKVQEPLQRLAQQLIEVFSPKVVQELLEVLGGPEPAQQSIQPISLALKSGSRSALYPNCTCATMSDTCSFWYGQGWFCEFGGPLICAFTDSGCGFLWLSPCDGICAYRYAKLRAL